VKRIRQEDEARKEAEQAASRAHIPPMVEKTGLVNKDFHDNITDSDARVREEQAGDIAGTGAATEKDVGSVSEDETVPQEEQKSPMNLGRERESIELGERKLLEEDARVQEEPVERKVSVGGFEMTIDDGVKRSGAAAFSRPIGKVMSVPKPEQTESRGLIGRDFSSYEVLIGRPAIPADKTGESGPVNFEGATSIDGSGLVKMVKVVIGKLPVIGVLGAKKATLSVAAVPAGMARRKLKKILIPVGVAALFTAAGGYWYLPEVIVELNIESIPVSYEGEIIAKLTAEGVNIDDAVVPARSEVVTNNGSESASATGIASRGEKASGDVTIYNKTDDDITVASGTVLSNGGLGFVLQGAVTVPKRPDPIGMGSVSGSIVAQEQGSEYNLEAGTTFSVGSVALSELSATNPSVFTGGTSEEYRVVSQNDIDTAAGKIRKRLYAESKTELLEALNGSKWVFVESSIKNEPDGGVTSDVPAGAEQDSVNVDVKTKSTALYYDGRALDTLVADLLMKDFGDTDLESVELSEDITKEITVKSAVVADGEIVLTVKITGYVMPILDKDAVADSLHGKPWVEGIADLKKMDYVSGEPSVDFSPAWFPGFAKRFPSRKGRISVVIKNVTPKVEEDSSDGGGE